jgi:hypothetical protein
MHFHHIIGSPIEESRENLRGYPEFVDKCCMNIARRIRR